MNEAGSLHIQYAGSSLKSQNKDFWIDKIKKNIERDEKVNRLLKGMDWTVLRFWGKDIMNNTAECIRTIEETVFERRMERECIKQ